MKPIRFEFEAIGTKWIIDIAKYPSSLSKADILIVIKERISEFDKTYSRFLKNSLVTKMSKSKGKYILPPDAKQMFDLYLSLYKITGGTFTPLIGNLISSAGYDANYSFKKQKLEKPYKWEEAIDYDFPNLTIKKPVILDFGAAGKGYLIDIVKELLIKRGITSFCIDAGGDIFYQDSDNKSIKVGLENPENTKQVIGVIEISNSSICGSSGNRRTWGEFNHIINPEKLSSENIIKAVWVIAKTTMLADALSTCLFFIEAGKLNKYYDFEYFILNKNFTFKKSKGFNAQLFLK